MFNSTGTHANNYYLPNKLKFNSTRALLIPIVPHVIPCMLNAWRSVDVEARDDEPSMMSALVLSGAACMIVTGPTGVLSIIG